MQGGEVVRRNLVLSGEGLDEMSIGQYGTFLKTLGRMGIDVRPGFLPETEDSPEPWEEAEKVTHEKLKEFARKNGYTESITTRIWFGLKFTYYNKKFRDRLRQTGEQMHDSARARKIDQYPILFEEIDYFAQAGELTPVDELRTLKMKSLIDTVEWLFKEGGYKKNSMPIHGFGHKSLSFLAHYVNENGNPAVPFTVKHHPNGDPDLKPEIIPPADQFEIDTDSPFLEEVGITNSKFLIVSDTSTIKVVSPNSVREFCKTIGISANRTSSLMFHFMNIANALVPIMSNKMGQAKPEILANGLVYLRTRESVGSYSRNKYIEWGVEPGVFVDLMREHQNGKIKIEGMSEFSTYIFTKYVKALQRKTGSVATDLEPSI